MKVVITMTKKKISLLFILFAILSYGGLLFPILFYMMKQWDTFFVHKEGMTVSLGFIIALVMIVLLIRVGFKKIKGIIWATLFMLTITCLNPIIHSLKDISFVFWIGVVIFTIFAIPMNYFKNLLFSYVDEGVRTRSREETKSTINSNGRC